jgi:hypothetical protein
MVGCCRIVCFRTVRGVGSNVFVIAFQTGGDRRGIFGVQSICGLCRRVISGCIL